MSRPRPRVQGATNPRLTTGSVPGSSGVKDVTGTEATVVPKKLSKGAAEAGEVSRREARAKAAKKAMRGSTWNIYKKNNANATNFDPCSGTTSTDPDTEVD